LDSSGAEDCGGGGFDIGFYAFELITITLYNSACDTLVNADQDYTWTLDASGGCAPTSLTVFTGNSSNSYLYLSQNDCFFYTCYHTRGNQTAGTPLTLC
jgi:hypothetical protein